MSDWYGPVGRRRRRAFVVSEITIGAMVASFDVEDVRLCSGLSTLAV